MNTSIKALTIAALGVLSSGITAFAVYSSDMDQNVNQTQQNRWSSASRMNMPENAMDDPSDGDMSNAPVRPYRADMPMYDGRVYSNGCCPKTRCHAPCKPRCAAPVCAPAPRCRALCEPEYRARPCCIRPGYAAPYGVNYYPGYGYGTQFTN